MIIKDDYYKQKSLIAFQNALTSLADEMSILNANQILLEQKQSGFVHSDLDKQLKKKATILGSYLNYVESCILTIKRSLRLIDLTILEYKSESDVLEIIEFFDDLERNLDKKIELDLSIGKIYSLRFNNLTVREDCGTRDQAIKTLRNAFERSESIVEDGVKDIGSIFLGSEYLNEKLYFGIKIQIEKIEMSRIKNLLNSNKEFKDFTKESVLQVLKEESTLMNKLGITKSLNANIIITSIKEAKYKVRHINLNFYDLKKIILKENDDKRFNLEIEQANKNDINQNIDSLNLCITFDGLNTTDIKSKLELIKAKCVSLEVVLTKMVVSNMLNQFESLKSLIFG